MVFRLELKLEGTPIDPHTPVKKGWGLLATKNLATIPLNRIKLLGLQIRQKQLLYLNVLS